MITKIKNIDIWLNDVRYQKAIILLFFGKRKRHPDDRIRNRRPDYMLIEEYSNVVLITGKHMPDLLID